jgi:hypothetical protein
MFSIEIRKRKVNALKTAQHIWSSKRPVYQDAVRASHVLGAMMAKLATDSPPSLSSGTFEKPDDSVYSVTAAQISHAPQQDVPVSEDSTYDMMDITSLESIFENPDMLNWVSMISQSFIRYTNRSQQNDIDNYLIDYSGTFVPAGFDMQETIT